MTMTLAGAWEDLLTRRPSFREALEPLGRIITAWEAFQVDSVRPCVCSAADAANTWATQSPLLASATPFFDRASIEPLLHYALDALDGIEDTQPFAEAWDRGEITPQDLLPAGGRIATMVAQEHSGLTQEALAFLAVAGLRPTLSAYFSQCRAHIDAALWDQGVCPCCGAPPGFADLLEDGRRQLACHLCDARWVLARLQCPFCGSREAADSIRLLAEGADEGYAITACRACGGYLKEVDRRTRFNAGPALVEDWGSPHLDLIAQRRNFWRPLPTPLQLVPTP